MHACMHRYKCRYLALSYIDTFMHTCTHALYIYIYTSLHSACIHTHIHICTNTYIHACMQILPKYYKYMRTNPNALLCRYLALSYTDTYIHACTHTYTYSLHSARIHTHTQTYIHTHMHTYIHACTHTYTDPLHSARIHTHAHTYIHTCTHTHIRYILHDTHIGREFSYFLLHNYIITILGPKKKLRILSLVPFLSPFTS
jgi:hypothetical protein